MSSARRRAAGDWRSLSALAPGAVRFVPNAGPPASRGRRAAHRRSRRFRRRSRRPRPTPAGDAPWRRGRRDGRPEQRVELFGGREESGRRGEAFRASLPQTRSSSSRSNCSWRCTASGDVARARASPGRPLERRASPAAPDASASLSSSSIAAISRPGTAPRRTLSTCERTVGRSASSSPGAEHEHRAWRRLLEELEERVLGVLVHALGVLDDGDAPRALHRGERQLANQRPDGAGLRRRLARRCGSAGPHPTAPAGAGPGGCRDRPSGTSRRRGRGGRPRPQPAQSSAAARSSARVVLPLPGGPESRRACGMAPVDAILAMAASAAGCPRVRQPPMSGIRLPAPPEFAGSCVAPEPSPPRRRVRRPRRRSPCAVRASAV